MTKKLLSVILSVIMVLSLCTMALVPVSADTKTGVCIDGNTYDVTVGEVITYNVWLEAEEIFEDIQATITYDADKLALLTTKGKEACPNLTSGLVYNPEMPGEVRLNAVCLDGIDFKDGKVFLTINFEVLDNSYSEINLVMEEMNFLGDSGAYFTDGKAVITDGIEILVNPHFMSGIRVDGQVYDVEAGDKVTFEVLLTAEEILENVQVTVRFNPNRLKLEDKTSTEACPNLTTGLVYNTKLPGEVRFNAICLDGIDFRSEKILVTLDFEVLDNRYSEINLDIQEMTIFGDGLKSYFTDSEAVITEGISVVQLFKCGVPVILGDANGDNKINVKDATEIQKAVAGILSLEDIGNFAADVDKNGKVNVKDATAIQKWVAGMDVNFPINQEDLFK